MRTHRGGRGRRIRSFLRRHPRGSVVLGFLTVGLVVFVLVWFQPQQAFLNKTVNESVPAGGSAPSAGSGGATATPGAGQTTVFASGRFRSLEHDTTGRASLVKLADGSVLLRIENLVTLNGPDLHLYLSEVRASDDARAYGERFVDLGKLKGNRGNQNYPVPSGVDVSKYRSAVIWCKRFTVGFGVASLS